MHPKIEHFRFNNWSIHLVPAKKGWNMKFHKTKLPHICTIHFHHCFHIALELLELEEVEVRNSFQFPPMRNKCAEIWSIPLPNCFRSAASYHPAEFLGILLGKDALNSNSSTKRCWNNAFENLNARGIQALHPAQNLAWLNETIVRNSCTHENKKEEETHTPIRMDSFCLQPKNWSRFNGLSYFP